ncbi:Carboxy-S-adenosyl-L-methionine synthase (Cx-SAM synthase) [Durusdinium trenchii]
MKSTVEEVRSRFDSDVERFSSLETGQSATIDAPLALELIAEAAWATTPNGQRVLDLGCGAGNFTLRLLKQQSVREITLVDLSRPMLDRAVERIEQASGVTPETIQGDLRDLDFAEASFDIILAGAVLHHLRSDEEWQRTFRKIYQSLAPGGGFWIFDLISSPTPELQHTFWKRYGEYLTTLKDEAYRDAVFAYIEKEDTPRPLIYQLDLLRQVGFSEVEILHKHGCFAAFGGVKRC